MTVSGSDAVPPLEITGDSDAARLESVRAATRAILENVLGAEPSVALIDVPTHENVGDNMIWEGEELYLRALGKSVEYEADVFRMDDALLRKRAPKGPILLHGGGNFGDIWPIFQDFREEVAQRFPDRKIVQLPQTVMFRSEERASQANQILGGHPDFTLLVRDAQSFARARQQLPDVHTVFCPDMALGWQPQPGRLARRRLVVLARGDRESAGDLVTGLRPLLTTEDLVKDWKLRGHQKALWLLTRIPGRLAKKSAWLRSSGFMYRVIHSANRFNRRQNLRAGVTLMAGAQAVVTDRLHAHVLACLLGVRNFVVDNNYGKVGSIYRDYSHLFEVATFVSDISQLPMAVGGFLVKEPIERSIGAGR